MTTTANIYRHNGAWAYALWIDGEFDHSDLLDATSEKGARAELALLYPGADVHRVTDITDPGQTYSLWWAAGDGTHAVAVGVYPTAEAAEDAIPEELAKLIAERQFLDAECDRDDTTDEIRAGRWIVHETSVAE